MEVDQVDGTDLGIEPAEIAGLGIDGIEGLQTSIASFFVPGHIVVTDADLGSPLQISEQIADIGKCRPGMDIASAKPSELVIPFEVVVDSIPNPPDPQA